MKKFIILLTMLLLILPNAQIVMASTDLQQQDIQTNDNNKVNELYNYITNMKTQNEVLNDLDAKSYIENFLNSGNGNISMDKLIKAFISYELKEVIATMKLMGIILIISIICALLNNLQKAFSNNSVSNIAYFACYSMVIIVLVRSFYIGSDAARTVISDMTNFMNALIPVLMVLLGSVGGLTEAAVMDPIIVAVITIACNIYINVILPIIFFSFVIQFVNSISEEYKISRLSKLLNSVALWAQGIIMTIFIGIVTIRGITSKTIDQVTAKTAKYAVDNFVPVVGKCLSDAISSVAGYALLLKNAVSSLGLVIIIIMVVFPIVKLLIMAFIFKLTAALIEPISDKRLVDCINASGDSLVLITSCLISVSVMYFIMISIMATAGKMAVGG